MNTFSILTLIVSSDSYPAVLPTSQDVAASVISTETIIFFPPLSGESKSAFKNEIWERREINISVKKRLRLEGLYTHTHTWFFNLEIPIHPHEYDGSPINSVLTPQYFPMRLLYI